MTDVHKKYIRQYDTADYLLKHKDAVEICVEFLIREGAEIDLEYLELICSEFEQKCYIGSDKWIGDVEKNE